MTVRDPRWYATGADEVLPGTTATGTAPFLKIREPKRDPVFPREAVKQGIRMGIVVALVEFDATGKPTGITRIFQWPRNIFERAVRDAVMTWQVDPSDPRVGQGKSFPPVSK